MEKIFDIKQLLQKPIAMMTGEELAFLIGSSMEPKANEATPIVQKRTYYGIEGIAQVFGCSVPTVSSAAASSMLPSRRSGERLSWMPTWHFNWQRKQKSTKKRKSNLWKRKTSLFVLALPIIR